MTPSKSVTISISVDPDVKASLERYAKEIDNTVSKFARNLIYWALEDLQLLDKVKLGKMMLPVDTNHFKKSMDLYSSGVDIQIADEELSKAVQISVIIDPGIKEVLEDYAKKFNMPFKTFATNLLYIGLSDMKLCRKLGIVQFAVSFKKALETYKSFRGK